MSVRVVVPLVSEFVPHDLARLVWKYVGGPVTAEQLADFMRVKCVVMKSRFPAEWCHNARERYVQACEDNEDEYNVHDEEDKDDDSYYDGPNWGRGQQIG